MVFLRLDRNEEFEQIIADDKERRPMYIRTWEIVDELEGYERFLDELSIVNR